MAPEAVEAMVPFLADRFGNPSGSHRESRRARRAVDDAREQIAALLGADFSELVFTSGGTEADNLAVMGGWEAVSAARPSPPALVCAAMEHHAVLHACRAVAQQTGAELREIPTAKDGIVELDALAESCTSEVGLVAVMTVNNEIGTLQPVEAVARLVRDRCPSALFHTDAVQAVVWTEVGARATPADLMAVSAHKFGGPQGVGALVVRNGAPLRPLIHGGGQERDRRSGTPNVAGIVAMAAALTVAHAARPESVARVSGLRDRLGDGLLASVTGVTETAARDHTVAGHLHLRFAGLDREALVILLDEAGVSVSAGAACASGAVEPSHVLVSMGLGPEEAAGGIRFSLGPTTTVAEIDHALAVVPSAVAQLRD